MQMIKGRFDASKDYYLRNTPDQPKLAIANYVRQNGVLVPENTLDLTEALDYIKKKPDSDDICRSECEQDYYGSSGLLKSPYLKGFASLGRAGSYDDLRAAILEEEKRNNKITLHCKLLGIDEEQFKNTISYSFWQEVPGYNVKVIADSAVGGKYHIFFTWPQEDGMHECYATIKGTELHMTPSRIPQWVVSRFGELTQTYDKIRNLDNFDSNNCPIMEFQIADEKFGKNAGKVYSLQYHRGADFKEAEFVLSKETCKHGKMASFVRGATPEDGFIYKVVYSPAWPVTDPDMAKIDFDEKAAYDEHQNLPFTELMVRIRALEMIDQRRHSTDKVLENATGHNDISKLFKTHVSVVHRLEEYPAYGLDGLYTHNELMSLLRNRKEGEKVELLLRVRSDGTTGCVERI